MAAAPTRDAIEVRESIEAKGDVDDDVEMEDADADAKDNEPRKAANKGKDADMAHDRDNDDDDEKDQDEDEDEDEEESDSAKDLLQLIRDTSEYLCRYTIKVDGESVTLWPPRPGTHAVPHDLSAR